MNNKFNFLIPCIFKLIHLELKLAQGKQKQERAANIQIRLRKLKTVLLFSYICLSRLHINKENEKLDNIFTGRQTGRP